MECPLRLVDGCGLEREGRFVTDGVADATSRGLRPFVLKGYPMLEQDYLMRIILQFAEIVRRSWTKAKDEHDPKRAADMLEDAVGQATDMDGAALLSLATESIASVMQISGVDPRVTEYIARSLLLASGYLREAGEFELAAVREGQARAIASEYGFGLPASPEDLALLMDEVDAELAQAAEPSLAAMGFEGPAELADPLVEKANGQRE